MKRELAALIAAVGVLAAAAFLAMPSQAATGHLFIGQSCLPDGRVRVDFTWQDNDPTANQQWLDLSLFNNDWEWGTFLGAGPMPGRQAALHWEGLIPNATHYVRLNQLLPTGFWDQSPTFYFTTGDCSSVAPPPPPPTNGRARVPAPIHEAKVLSVDGSAYYLDIQAGLPGGCALADGHESSRSGNDITVRVWNTLPTDARPCTLIYGMYDLTVPLGNLTAGQHYRIFVNDMVIDFTPDQ